MNDKELKTSPKQRIFIILIAIFMVGSIVASYAAIVINGSQGSATTAESGEVDEAKVEEYKEAYDQIQAEFSEATKADYDKFSRYKTEIKAYNETTANSEGVQTKDLEKGSGREITEGDTDYLAYYVGWCADESIFDSSYDDNKNPKAFAKILDASLGMIEGWNIGVEGMRLEGIREVTVPGELAYGDSMEICGGKNKPLKFLIYAKEKTEKLDNLSKKLDDAYMRYQYAQYGIDYDSVKANEG